MPLRLQGRLLVVGATLLLIYLLTGCLTIGDTKDPMMGHHAEPVEPAGPLVGDGVFEQMGSVHIPFNTEQDVYYPVPYVSPPNLTLGGDECELLTQARDHFRIKKLSPGTITWKAKGVKVLVTQAPPVVNPTTANPTPSSGTHLPSEPVPFTPQP